MYCFYQQYRLLLRINVCRSILPNKDKTDRMTKIVIRDVARLFCCNTCTGFVLTTFHFIVHSVKEPQRKLGNMLTPPVSDFHFPFGVPRNLLNV
jgi:hypothetical protein